MMSLSGSRVNGSSDLSLLPAPCGLRERLQLAEVALPRRVHRSADAVVASAGGDPVGDVARIVVVEAGKHLLMAPLAEERQALFGLNRDSS